MKIKANWLPTLLALHRLPGMGPVKLNGILTEIQTRLMQTMQSTLPSTLCDFKEIAFAKNDDCLLFPGKADWHGVDLDLRWMENKNHHIITVFDEGYPKLLKEIHSAPPILFVAGDVPLLSMPQIAMVGSRNPTSTGRETACSFAKQLSEQGLCITSGLASGIDTAAHSGALRVGGKTIAVLANGLDKIYPAINQKLAQEIMEQGALVSEFPIGVSPKASHFPRRNRVISGLSMGTLVVEATLRSGSLITAKYALDQGREIFAIPGSIYSTQAQGCHALIRQGAKLVETPQDVLEEMESLLRYVSRANELGGMTLASSPQMGTLIDKDDSNFQGSKRKALSNIGDEGSQEGLQDIGKGRGMERKVFDHIGFERTSLDTLVVRCGLTMTQVSSIILELELKGHIVSCVGGYVRAKGKRAL